MVIVDGAHNIQGAKILSENLIKYFPGKEITFIVGILADKDYKSMLEIIMPMGLRFITVTPNSNRALGANLLADYIMDFNRNVIVAEKVEKAIDLAIELCEQEEIICAFGSLYFIGVI